MSSTHCARRNLTPCALLTRRPGERAASRRWRVSVFINYLSTYCSSRSNLANAIKRPTPKVQSMAAIMIAVKSSCFN